MVPLLAWCERMLFEPHGCNSLRPHQLEEADPESFLDDEIDFGLLFDNVRKTSQKLL